MSEGLSPEQIKQLSKHYDKGLQRRARTGVDFRVTATPSGVKVENVKKEEAQSEKPKEQ